jgi:hypothetical protein
MASMNSTQQATQVKCSRARGLTASLPCGKTPPGGGQHQLCGGWMGGVDRWRGGSDGGGGVGGMCGECVRGVNRSRGGGGGSRSRARDYAANDCRHRHEATSKQPICTTQQVFGQSGCQHRVTADCRQLVLLVARFRDSGAAVDVLSSLAALPS